MHYRSHDRMILTNCSYNTTISWPEEGQTYNEWVAPSEPPLIWSG